MERTGPGELRHLCEDYKSRGRGGRPAFTADARSGRRSESGVVAGWKFDRFPAQIECGNQFGLMLMPALGGQERKLAEVSIPETGGFYSPYLAWTPDSQSLIITDHASAGRPTALFLVLSALGKSNN